MATDPSCLQPISWRTIDAGIPVATDVYFWPTDDSVPTLFCAAGKTPGLAKTRQTASRAEPRLFVARRDGAAYQRYLRENWFDLVHSPGKRSCERVGMIGDVAREAMRFSFRGGITDKIVDTAREMASCICDVLDGQSALASELYDVLHHDYATFTHSTNVALYCVILARELGFAAKELQSIAMGGLLHDIGKLEIDDNLLNKSGQLTQLQYREIMQHPLHGFRRLVDRNDIFFGQLMMVYQHHERVDGSGYPTSVATTEIHDWAKICAITDAYEALTAYRPYRPVATPQQAIDTLSQTEGALDEEMLDCWRQLICQTA